MNTTTTTSADASDVVNQIMAAVNAQNMSRYLAVQHPEAEFVLPGGVTLRGHDSIKQYIQAQWTAFPDGHQSIRLSTEAGWPPRSSLPAPTPAHWQLRMGPYPPPVDL